MPGYGPIPTTAYDEEMERLRRGVAGPGPSARAPSPLQAPIGAVPPALKAFTSAPYGPGPTSEGDFPLPPNGAVNNEGATLVDAATEKESEVAKSWQEKLFTPQRQDAWQAITNGLKDLDKALNPPSKLVNFGAPYKGPPLEPIQNQGQINLQQLMRYISSMNQGRGRY